MHQSSRLLLSALLPFVLTIVVCGLLSALGCSPREDSPLADSEPAATHQEPLEAFPELLELGLSSAAFSNSRPMRLGSLEYVETTERTQTLHELEVKGNDTVVVELRHSIKIQGSEDDVGASPTAVTIEKDILYGLRGMLKFTETHKRTVGDTIEDHWRNRITHIIKAEGNLFPIDFANTGHLIFDSEIENLITGDIVEMTNDYELTVVEVLEADEYLSKMPFEGLRERIRQRVYAVELRWTFGPKGERLVTRNQTFFYSTDLGFVMPCCNSDTTHYTIDNISLSTDS